jgi:hypothetical protein
MSRLDPITPKSQDEDGDEPSRGPNLTLIFTLLGLALLIAIVVAVFIVLPFYQRR